MSFPDAPGIYKEHTNGASVPVVVNRAPVLLNAENGDSGEKRRFTSAEKRLMRVIADPENHTKTHREKAELARVGESRYYEILRDPWFKEQERQLMLSHLHGELAPVVQACIDSAKKVGREGVADRRVILECAGVYEPRKTVHHTGEIKHVGVIVGVAHDEI